MEDLIQEYQQTLKIVLKAHKEATVERERLLLGRMVSDLRYAIQWMAAGRQPEVVRGNGTAGGLSAGSTYRSTSL